MPDMFDLTEVPMPSPVDVSPPQEVTLHIMRGSVSIDEIETPMTPHNLSEALAEIGMDETASTFDCNTLGGCCYEYQMAKGWIDTEDWLDRAIQILMDFSEKCHALQGDYISLSPKASN